MFRIRDRVSVASRWAMGPRGTGRRGFSLVEVLISIALLSLLSLITISGMIYHSRVAKSNLARQRMAEGARRFIQNAQIFAIDATMVRVDEGPAGNNTVLTIGRPDPDDSSNVIVKQYAFLDGDGNAATLGDNVLVERDEDDPDSTSGKVLMEYVSRVSGQDVFKRVGSAAYPLFEVNLHVGDRTYPANNADNAFTGPGYQGFRINAFVGRGY